MPKPLHYLAWTGAVVALAVTLTGCIQMPSNPPSPVITDSTETDETKEAEPISQLESMKLRADAVSELDSFFQRLDSSGFDRDVFIAVINKNEHPISKRSSLTLMKEGSFFGMIELGHLSKFEQSEAVTTASMLAIERDVLTKQKLMELKPVKVNDVVVSRDGQYATLTSSHSDVPLLDVQLIRVGDEWKIDGISFLELYPSEEAA